MRIDNICIFLYPSHQDCLKLIIIFKKYLTECESAFKFALQTPRLSEFSMASSTLFITSRISAFNSEVELSLDCLEEKS